MGHAVFSNIWTPLFFFFLVCVSILLQCRNPTDKGFAFLLWARETSRDSQGAETGNSSSKESPEGHSAGYQQAGPHQQGEPGASSRSPRTYFADHFLSLQLLSCVDQQNKPSVPHLTEKVKRSLKWHFLAGGYGTQRQESLEKRR